MMRWALAILFLFIATSATADLNSAIAELRQEPKIKDVHFEPSVGTLLIGVIDNGRNRDGYADYVCAVLAENNAVNDVELVKIVDIVKVNRHADFSAIGSSRCRYGRNP